MSRKSPFAIQKAVIGIGGEPKSIKKLRSGDLLIETESVLQSKSFLLAQTFLDFPLVVFPHKSLNSCPDVISETYLLCASEAEILEGISNQGVTQLSQTYAQAFNSIHNYPNRSKYNKHSRPSFAMPDITNQMPTTSSSMSAVSTSSSSTQAHLLPSSSSVITSIQSESQLSIPISSTTTSPDNSLNTPATSLSTEIRLFTTTSNKFAALSTENQPSVPLLESAGTTSNSEHSNASKIPKSVKQNFKK
ncbi:uncharacterized protein TNCV_961071 [Trichonephila clavipes]|uniref:Uncharacterized protein n=1 Tax=Trichonephila clavipes TaxID=2585209 RepID=A0A8X6S2U8_TRICX|nr:uncharacterized protein TNCV_961071 [Trichonephila clavipes]